MISYFKRCNYEQCFYEYIYDIKAACYHGFPVTYYSIDWKNSVYDETLFAGSYEKIGVGDLSGMKWKKILFLPVHEVEPIVPTNNGTEKGLTMHESELSSIVFPSKYGLKPYEWDVVHFDQRFMFPDIGDDSPVFVVANTDPATYGTLTEWKCRLKVAPFRLSDIKKQISSEYMFLDSTKQIHRLDIAIILLKLQDRSNSSSQVLTALFDDLTGYYLK